MKYYQPAKKEVLPGLAFDKGTEIKSFYYNALQFYDRYFIRIIVLIYPIIQESPNKHNDLKQWHL